jgi:hypothetical protein
MPGATPLASDSKIEIISPVVIACTWSAREPSASYQDFRSRQRSGGRPTS